MRFAAGSTRFPSFPRSRPLFTAAVTASLDQPVGISENVSAADAKSIAGIILTISITAINRAVNLLDFLIPKLLLITVVHILV